MKFLLRTRVILVALAVATIALPLIGQNSPQEEAALQAWQTYATPGAPQKMLLEFVGKWKVESKMWPMPGTEPIVSSATSEVTSWWDGRYVIEKFKGMTISGPMEGFSITGFDNLKRKYFTIWMDNGSTGVMISEGTADAGGKVITFFGEMPDPPSKSFKKARMVLTTVDKKTRHLEMFTPGPGGKKFKSMEMIYTRQP